MSNTRDTNFFTQIFTNCCGEWLLVNEKMMLMMGFVGVGVCSKHFYSYLFSNCWEFMSKIVVGQL